ncbi:MAG: hypothetical protein ACE5H2_03880 [Terriglobia bacterium]
MAPATGEEQSIAPTVLRMKHLGANPAPEVSGLDPLPGKSHYFLGNDPTTWRTHIPHYARVRYKDVYPGIDLIFYGLPRSRRAGQREVALRVPQGDPELVERVAGLPQAGLFGAPKLRDGAETPLAVPARRGGPALSPEASGRRP